jgi:hypothetical protein
MDRSGQHRAPAALTTGKNPGTHRIGGWVGHTAGLETPEPVLLARS